MRGIVVPTGMRRALRTGLGFAALGIGTSVCGSGLVMLMLLLEGVPNDVGDRNWIVLLVAAAYIAFSIVVGSVWTMWLHRRTAIWFLFGRLPDRAEAARALRLPLDTAIVTAVLWAGGTALFAILNGILGSWREALGVGMTVGLGGLTTVGLNYLAAEWVVRPVMTRALEVSPPQTSSPVTVLTRLIVTWALASGVPMLGVLLLVIEPTVGRNDPKYPLILLAVIGLVIGAAATALLARAVGAPLRRLRLALDQVAHGRTDVHVPVDDNSEIGLLQASVNDMVAGLRERERMRDLFGRHVGNDVARHALEFGASLSGDVREVTALFVDIVDSTALAYQLRPEDLVDKLNRFFASVITAVDANGGLVNKFQGDAALCVFGAPTELADPCGSALRAARAIRDAVRDTGELAVGIGVACGRVFAGQLGTSSRFEYTVIGDAVNEAARLTDTAKQVEGRVLASAPTIRAASPAERAHWHEYGHVELRGRDRPTLAWTTGG